MKTVKITMKDNTVYAFRPEGFSTHKEIKVRYEQGFVVVTDQYETETAIPSADIKEVIVRTV